MCYLRWTEFKVTMKVTSWIFLKHTAISNLCSFPYFKEHYSSPSSFDMHQSSLWTVLWNWNYIITSKWCIFKRCSLVGYLTEDNFINWYIVLHRHNFFSTFWCSCRDPRLASRCQTCTTQKIINFTRIFSSSSSKNFTLSERIYATQKLWLSHKR